MAMPPPSFLSLTISSVRMGSKWQKMGGSGGLAAPTDVTGRPPLPQSGCTRCRGTGCGAGKWLHILRSQTESVWHVLNVSGPVTK